LLVEVASARARRARCAARSHRSKLKDGSCATRCHGQAVAISSVAIAPTGIAFAIETKIRNYSSEDPARTCEMAAWLYARRRRWCRHGAVPVLCVVHARQVEHVGAGVLIVSLDRLVSALRVSAGTVARPAFLAPLDARGAR